MKNTQIIGYLIIVSFIATVAILCLGFMSMLQNSRFYKHSNFLMQLRVMAQGVTLALFALWLWMRQ